MRLGTVIVHVDDMASQLAFYRDTLGLPVLEESEYWSVLDAGGCRIALHAGGRGTIRLAFSVEDLDGVRAELGTSGASVGEPRSPAPGVRVADFADPEGNRLSIDEHT